MKKQTASSETDNRAFVVTAVFTTHKTVYAKSVSEALRLAEDSLVEEGATSKNLSNWDAHEV